MYPDNIILGLDLYTILLCVAAISAIAVFRILADRHGLRAKLQNLCLFAAVASIGVGFLSAILFQAFYNIEKNGKLVINSETGMTFYGGLIGGAACFLLIYFAAGRYIFGKESVCSSNIYRVINIASPCILIAHALGRVGCLMAGCCHGAETDAWYGIYMKAIEKKVVPIQLYEAIFLFALFAILFYRVYNKKPYNLPIYMALYGVWRFVIEYARGDERGETFIPFLTPSQLTACIMVLGAVAMLYVELIHERRLKREVMEKI